MVLLQIIKHIMVLIKYANSKKCILSSNLHYRSDYLFIIYYLFSFLNSHASLSSLKSFNSSIFLLFSFFIRVCNCLLVRKSYLERRQRGTSSAAKQREIVLLRQNPAIFPAKTQQYFSSSSSPVNLCYYLYLLLFRWI